MVPRNQYVFVRTLLIVTTLAVLGLSVAVAVLIDRPEAAAGAGLVEPHHWIDYGGFNPATGRPEVAPLPD